MAKKSNTVPAVDATDKAIDGGIGTDSTVPAVDATKAAHATLNATLKAAGFDSKALYTRYTADPEDVKDDLAGQVAKHAKNSARGFDQTTADAIVAMFDAMAKANAPKAKLVKAIPEGLTEDLAQAWVIRHQTLAEYNAAKKAIDVLWCAALDASKLELDAVCKTVTDAGFAPDRKTGTIKTTKSGSTTNGEHGNSGKVKLQYGTTITVNGKSYAGWKDLAKNLIPSVYKGETNTNYIQNTTILDELVKFDGAEVFVKPTIVGETKEKALEAWKTSTAKTLLDAHPSITVHVS